MGAPQISVLIPTYRRPDYLREAIRSVLMQDGVDFELIVGDNSSEGAAVVAEFADERIRYVAHKPNRGMVGNWNFLLDMARAPYVALLMDDDRYLPGFISSAIRVLDAEPEVGLAFANHFIEADGQRWRRQSPLQEGTYHGFTTRVINDNPVALCASVFRRDAWRGVRPLPDTGAADVVLFARVAECGWAFHYIDQPFMIYRSHGGSYSSGVRFRHDVVVAWEAIQFTDPAAESARRSRLAMSLVSRAAGRVQFGERSAARDDLERARALGHPWTSRILLLKAAARLPGAGRGGRWAKSSWLRAVRGGTRAKP